MSAPQPDVSIVIPTHNRRPYLAEAVGRILAETAVDVEVIVVDDDSQDDTAAWLEGQTDPRLRWFRQSPGRGGSAARNRGFGEVRAEITMFHDDDDLLRPGALSKLLSMLRRHRNADGAAGTFLTFGSSRELPMRQTTPLIDIRATVWREHILYWNLPPGAAVWRTSAVRATGGWDESLRRCEDLDFNLRMYPRRVALTPATVLDYRVHDTQVDQFSEWHQELATSVRQTFVDTLQGRDRATGERILAARPAYFSAMAAFNRAEYGRAAKLFASVLRGAPYLARSPILNPWLDGMLAKSLVLSATPRPVAVRMRAMRRHRKQRASKVSNP